MLSFDGVAPTLADGLTVRRPRFDALAKKRLKRLCKTNCRYTFHCYRIRKRRTTSSRRSAQPYLNSGTSNTAMSPTIYYFRTCPLWWRGLLLFRALVLRFFSCCTRAAMGIAFCRCFWRSLMPPVFFFFNLLRAPNASRPSRPSITLSRRSALSLRRLWRPVAHRAVNSEYVFAQHARAPRGCGQCKHCEPFPPTVLPQTSPYKCCSPCSAAHAPVSNPSQHLHPPPEENKAPTCEVARRDLRV